MAVDHRWHRNASADCLPFVFADDVRDLPGTFLWTLHFRPAPLLMVAALVEIVSAVCQVLSGHSNAPLTGGPAVRAGEAAALDAKRRKAAAKPPFSHSAPAAPSSGPRWGTCPNS